MYDDRSAYAIGIRDVIAAWLFCLAVAGVFLIYAPVTAGMAGPAVRAHAVLTRPVPTFFCRTRINRDTARSPWRQRV
ncbi:MAG TPA: hypothetical protein VGS13_10440 [Stellaceae bacterium]|nr:hypothetical protein [Stellaceae bacterium]